MEKEVRKGDESQNTKEEAEGRTRDEEGRSPSRKLKEEGHSLNQSKLETFRVERKMVMVMVDDRAKKKAILLSS